MESSGSVEKMLDDMGRRHNPEMFAKLNKMLVRYLEQYPGQQEGFLKFLVGGLTLVYDANIVQKALRYELREKRESDLISAARSKFIAPYAPKMLDEEIAEHAEEIATDCGVTPLQVLNHYLFKIRPHLRLVDPTNMIVFEEIKAGIRDIDDADYVAVYFERNAARIVTEDKDIKDFVGEEKVYAVNDVCKINILYRKQYVVMYLNIFNIIAFFAIVAGIVMALKKLWKVFLGIAAFLAVFLLLLRLSDKKRFDDVIAEITQKLGNMKETIAKVWVGVKPFLAEYITECLERTEDFQSKVGALAKDGAIIPSGKHIAGAPLTYIGFIRMIMLAKKREAVKEKDVCVIFAELGYRVTGKNSHKKNIRLTLKDTRYFTRRMDKKYTLVTQ